MKKRQGSKTPKGKSVKKTLSFTISPKKEWMPRHSQSENRGRKNNDPKRVTTLSPSGEPLTPEQQGNIVILLGKDTVFKAEKY